MKSGLFRTAAALPLAALLFAAPAVRAADPAPALKDLEGLWEAHGYFGPDLRGPVVIDRVGPGWRADLRGRYASGVVAGSKVAFDFGEGRVLTLDLKAAGGPNAFWRQGAGASTLTPVPLRAEAKGRLSGVVYPVDDRLTLYLPIRVGADGRATTFLRNPERNVGRFLRLDQVELVGGELRLLGKPFGAREQQVVGRGMFDADNQTLSIYIPRVGQTYEFHRVEPGRPTGFYPRVGAVPYRYAAPPARIDGWPVGTLEEAGISRQGMERFIQTLIDLPMDTAGASDLHAVLIARRGKLVLEEYFHGYDRDQIHDTRSAGKSIAATVFGAAMNAGYPLSPQTPVYRTLGYPAADARKTAMTAEHLLLQTSGFHCDDSDENAPGNEDVMQEQRQQPDWYRYALDLPMVSEPGKAAPVYCSTQPNLLGAVTARAAGRRLEDLFRDLVAEPMGIRRYALNLQPTGEYYWGGGAQLAPRDFMKFAQVMMDGGTWRGRRVVSREFAARSTSPLEQFGNRQYGYLWWSQTYPYKGREVRAFYAAGNGGQIAMAIPELELVICFMGGNYSDRAARIPQEKYVPEMILPAVGD